MHFWVLELSSLTYDVEFPSVRCENYWLMKKLLGPDWVELSLAGKTKVNSGKKKGRVRKNPWSHHQRQILGTFPGKA